MHWNSINYLSLLFFDYYIPDDTNEKASESISAARREVLSFLENRRIQIAGRYRVPEITVVDAIENDYIYNKEYGFYEKR